MAEPKETDSDINLYLVAKNQRRIMLILYFVILAAGLGKAVMSGITPEGEEITVAQLAKYERINAIIWAVLWASCVLAVFPARNLLREIGNEKWKLHAFTIAIIWPLIGIVALLFINRITCNLLKEHNVAIGKLKMVDTSTLEILLEEYVSE